MEGKGDLVCRSSAHTYARHKPHNKSKHPHDYQGSGGIGRNLRFVLQIDDSEMRLGFRV